MSTIVTRAGKGTALTWTEMDDNFTNLNNDKYESGDNPTFGTVTATTYSQLPEFDGVADGIVVAGANGTTKFLREDGAWEVPAGGGSAIPDTEIAFGDGTGVTSTSNFTFDVTNQNWSLFWPTGVTTAGEVSLNSSSGASPAGGGHFYISGGNAIGAGAAAAGGDVGLYGGSPRGAGEPGGVELGTAGGTIRLDGLGALNINSDPGAANEVLTSAGAGASPTWSSAFNGTTLEMSSTATFLGGVYLQAASAAAIGDWRFRTSAGVMYLDYYDGGSWLQRMTFASFGVGVANTLNVGTDLTVAGASIVQNSQSAAYTLVAGDANKHILHPSADTTARIFTIPANASVPFAIGTAVTFVNQDSAGVITIAITSDTMRLAGAGTTGSRTLAANGMATALKITSTEWIISGTGLT